PPIGRPTSKRTRVGVSGELALILNYQPGMGRHGPSDPAGHFLSGRGLDLERDRAAPHHRRVDSLELSGIPWLGEADAYHDHQFRWSARHGIIHPWLTRSLRLGARSACQRMPWSSLSGRPDRGSRPSPGGTSRTRRAFLRTVSE